MPKPKATEVDSSNTSRDPKGRFLMANKGGPGRPKGSRNKLGEEFLDDLIEEWRASGKKALALCAAREPTQFCKLVSNILPKEVLSMALNVNATTTFSDRQEAKAFLAAFRVCQTEPIEDVVEGQLVPEGWNHDDDD